MRGNRQFLVWTGWGVEQIVFGRATLAGRFFWIVDGSHRSGDLKTVSLALQVFSFELRRHPPGSLQGRWFLRPLYCGLVTIFFPAPSQDPF